MTNASSQLEITSERFPNLTHSQKENLRAIGPLPEFVYRGSPDTALFPMNTRPVSWSLLGDSQDIKYLPPADSEGKRKVLYIGGLYTAINYTGIVNHFWGSADGSERPFDSFTLDELMKIDGKGKTPEQLAIQYPHLYRIRMADIISRLSPGTVIVRDTAQGGGKDAWAVVGALTADIPATRIQYLGGDDRLFFDTSTGQTVSGIDRITDLELNNHTPYGVCRGSGFSR